MPAGMSNPGTVCPERESCIPNCSQGHTRGLPQYHTSSAWGSPARLSLRAPRSIFPSAQEPHRSFCPSTPGVPHCPRAGGGTKPIWSTWTGVEREGVSSILPRAMSSTMLTGHHGRVPIPKHPHPKASPSQRRAALPTSPRCPSHVPAGSSLTGCPGARRAAGGHRGRALPSWRAAGPRPGPDPGSLLPRGPPLPARHRPGTAPEPRTARPGTGTACGMGAGGNGEKKGEKGRKERRVVGRMGN